ncbi:MAG: hypothetical protein LR015_06320 [Verrucomicrobia bacterium]|nr:hypothetical protein [Verrucomicrobiota bacterium]
MRSEDTWRKEAEEFLAVAGQFSLGHLDTEQSHPATAQLSVDALTLLSKQ